MPKAFEHSILHAEFTKGLRVPDTVAQWAQQLAIWEEDHSHPNPFVVTFKGKHDLARG